MPSRLTVAPRNLGRNGLKPTGAIAETFPRAGGVTIASQAALTSGQTRFFAIYLYQGEMVSTITFVSSSTPGSGMTNQWFTLAGTDGSQLGITNDDGATAWGASTAKTLTLAAAYPVPSDGTYYIGCMVAGTPPSLAGANMNTAITGITPILSRSDSTHTGLTNPASSPGTFTLGAAASQMAYAFVS